jgi:hypothetical protein
MLAAPWRFLLAPLAMAGGWYWTVAGCWMRATPAKWNKAWRLKT